MNYLPLQNLLFVLENQAILFLYGIAGLMVIIAGIDWYRRARSVNKQVSKNLNLRSKRAKAPRPAPQVESTPDKSVTEILHEDLTVTIAQATVVIFEAKNYAVALYYDLEKTDAPVVIAKGVNDIAVNIRELALEKNIPCVENPSLVHTLYTHVEVDQQIPPQYYKTVAKVIRFVLGYDRVSPKSIKAIEPK